MLAACARYFRRQVLPRWFSIVSGSELWVAAGLSALFGLGVNKTGIGQAKVGDVTTAVLAYAAVAFGFSVAGLTIALTLPDASFAEELATVRKVARRGRLSSVLERFQPRDADAYSDLLFIFSWTALAHWVAVIASFAVLIAWGFDQHLVSAGSGHRAVASLLAFCALYAVLLFLLTLLTLSQVGQVYIRCLRARVAQHN
jgi:hypothetical protein